MNTANMLKWADALESGEFAQGTGALAVLDEPAEPGPWDGTGTVRYCCLGVACILAMRDGIDLEITVTETAGGKFCLAYDENWSYLPPRVADWLGSETDPRLPYGKASLSASYLNDAKGLGFAAIAAAVRQEAS